MSFKEAVKKYQSYIPTLIMTVLTWIFTSVGQNVISSIREFRQEYGMMKNDIASLKQTAAANKETNDNQTQMISGLQGSDLRQDKEIEENKSEAKIKFASIFTSIEYLNLHSVFK